MVVLNRTLVRRVQNLSLSTHRNAQRSEFLLENPKNTKIHQTIESSPLYNKILEKWGASNNPQNSTDHLTLKISSPITDQPICTLTADTIDSVDEKISLSVKAFEDWSNYTTLERSNLMLQLGRKLEIYKNELAQLMTIENGKNLFESKVEIGVGSAACTWFAAEARRAYGDVIPAIHKNHTAMTVKQPVGPCGMITPWNFPSAMVTRKAFPALAVGCSVVLKPASETPLSALALQIIAEESGLPANLLQIILSSGDNDNFGFNDNTAEIGSKLFTDQRIKAVSFTGSTRVGKILMQQAAGTVKKSCMELGGNAPFIVFKTGDIDKAITGLLAAKFRNTGQVCIAPNRILVHKEIYNQFIDELKIRMEKKLRFGTPENPKTTIGPQIYERAVPNLEQIITDAVNKGANLILGGKARPDLGKSYFEPTLLTDMTNNMIGFTEEIFGPIVSVGSFNDENEALNIANQGQHGLAAYIYSNDQKEIWRVANKIETGMLGINQVAVSTIEYPFGGTRESGIGREGSKYGVDSYLETKLINWNWS